MRDSIPMDLSKGTDAPPMHHFGARSRPFGNV